MAGNLNTRHYNGLGIALLFSIFVLAFQNCNPIGESSSTSSSSLDNLNGELDPCENLSAADNKAPVIEAITRNGASAVGTTIDLPIGMDQYSGHGETINVTVRARTSVDRDETNVTSLNGQDIAQVNCSADPRLSRNNSEFNLNCNGTIRSLGNGVYEGQIRIRPDDGECVDQTFTVNVTVTDRLIQCPTRNQDLRRTSNSLSFRVRTINKCLPTDKIAATSAERNAKFGGRVAIDGNYAVATASGDSANGVDSGAAYVYFFNGSSWVQQQKLIALDGTAGDEILGVAISGDTIVLGAPYHGANGAAYVFRRSASSWAQVKKLVPSQPNSGGNDAFGYDVAIANGRIAVGAFGDNSSGIEAGAVYVFTGSGWTNVQKLRPSGLAAFDNFGLSLAMNGSTLAIAAPVADDGPDPTSGAVYVYNYGTGFSLVDTLVPASPLKSFGVGLDVHLGKIAVGSPKTTSAGRNARADAGRVTIFENTSGSWSQTAQFSHADPSQEDYFGYAVAIENNRLIVGAPWQEQRTGAVYYFVRNSDRSWTQTFKVRARMGDRDIEDRFGEDVDLSGSRMISGSTLDDYTNVSGEFLLNAGRGYIIDLSKAQ